MRWRVHEKHLLNHYASYWRKRSETHLVKLFRCWGAERRESHKNGEHVGVSSHDPGAEKRVPVDRRLFTQPAVQGVRACKDFGIKEMVQTKSLLYRSSPRY